MTPVRHGAFFENALLGQMTPVGFGHSDIVCVVPREEAIGDAGGNPVARLLQGLHAGAGFADRLLIGLPVNKFDIGAVVIGDDAGRVGQDAGVIRTAVDLRYKGVLPRAVHHSENGKGDGLLLRHIDAGTVGIQAGDGCEAVDPHVEPVHPLVEALQVFAGLVETNERAGTVRHEDVSLPLISHGGPQKRDEIHGSQLPIPVFPDRIVLH